MLFDSVLCFLVPAFGCLVLLDVFFVLNVEGFVDRPKQVRNFELLFPADIRKRI